MVVEWDGERAGRRSPHSRRTSLDDAVQERERDRVCEGDGLQVRHRLDDGGSQRINSLLYIASVTQHRDLDARRDISRKITDGKTR